MSLGKRLREVHAKYEARSKKQDYGLDPIAIPHRFPEQQDAEVVAFIASCFAYGSRKVFVPLMERYIERLGKHPAKKLREATDQKLDKLVADFKYRFNDELDLKGLYLFLRTRLTKNGSLGQYFHGEYRKGEKEEHPILAMLNRVERMYGDTLLEVKGKKVELRTRKSSMYLLPAPNKGSTCKRALMFTRWMIRSGQPDFGFWTWAKPAELIVPLDTHLKQVSIRLGMLPENASSSMKTAIKLTDKLRKYDKADPVKFDYALYMLGAEGHETVKD